MKVFSEAGQTALEAGDALGVGAVFIACAPTPVRIWAGYGPLLIDGATFQGIGDRGLVTASGGSLGGAAQDVTLTLSGVDPDVMALLDAEALRDSPTVVWRLIFDCNGLTLLDAPVFARGKLDQLIIEETPAGTSTLSAKAEGAAKGLGRSRNRTRSDADQRQDDANDAGFSATSYAGQKTMYWGGKLPSNVSSWPGVSGATGTRFDEGM